MSIEDINNAAAAQNALTARINGFLDTADAQIAQRRNAYDALANDLEGLFYRWVFVDQTNGDDANDGSRESPVQSIRQAAKIQPNGTATVIHIFGDYRVTDRERLARGYYVITSEDDDNRSTISFAPELDAVSLSAPGITMNEALSELHFQKVNLHFEPVSAHVTRPWSISTRGATAVYLQNCDITTAAGNDRVLLENNGVAILTVKSTTYPAEMAGHWMVRIRAGTVSADVPRLLTTLNTL